MNIPGSLQELDNDGYEVMDEVGGNFETLGIAALYGFGVYFCALCSIAIQPK